MKTKVVAPSVGERKHCAWVGGSILGSMAGFPDLWVSRQEFLDRGSEVVHRKCP